jgi:hypothetical protein
MEVQLLIKSLYLLFLAFCSDCAVPKKCSEEERERERAREREVFIDNQEVTEGR